MSPLPSSRYVSLTTYRRSGDAVPTPVWAAPDGPELVVWTRADSGKVKRLRHTARVTVASCDVRGNVEGPPVEGTAELLAPADWPPALRALATKYGWQWQIAYGSGRLVGLVRRRERRAMIRISPTPHPAPDPGPPAQH